MSGNFPFIVRPPRGDERHIIHGADNGAEVLVFENARLARNERNRNGDLFTIENLNELAASLPLMPMVDEHAVPGRSSRIIGVFTDARVDRFDDGYYYLLAQGILYPAREPQIVAEIKDGVRQQSIEAVSEVAICSVCGRSFKSPDEYCSHLAPLRSGLALAENVSRLHQHMRARGAAAVKDPAGNNVGFNTSRFVVIASEFEAEEQVMSQQQEHELLAGQLKDAQEQIKALNQRIAELEDQAKAAQELAEQAEKLANQLEASRHANQLIATRITQMITSGVPKEVIDEYLGKVAEWDEGTFNLIIAGFQHAKKESISGRQFVNDQPDDDNPFSIFGG